MLYELTKTERYLSPFSGLAKILSVGLSNQYNSFFVSLTVEELFVLNQENPYVRFKWRQFVNHGIYQKSVYKIWFHRFQNYSDKIHSLLCFKIK